MSPKDIKVLIDIDDTLIDLLPAWVDWLNNKYGTSVKVDDIDDWAIANFFPEIPKKEVFAPLGDMLFWSTVKPKNGAEIYLEKLIKEGFDLHLCSATHYETIKPKYCLVIKKYFPYFPWDRVIITSHKDMIKGDVLIDDGAHNLETFEGVQVVFDAPHNQGYENSHYDTYRVKSWKEIYSLLNGLVGFEADDC